MPQPNDRNVPPRAPDGGAQPYISPQPHGGVSQPGDGQPHQGGQPPGAAQPHATPAPAVADDRHVSLSLVSHTNVGKTTLARTLLGRDIGDVRDEAHVTDTADRFVLVQTGSGDVLSLWDTPGFGDSARLARRLSKADGGPIGWMTAQVWDRVQDRALHSSQAAVRNVRDEADVVLYLVNAAEDPEEAGYVDPEMQILEWIGKPVVVLVNQIGAPSDPSVEAAEVGRWATHLRDMPAVRRVLALDAFTRCWVQEGLLLAEVGRWVPQPKQPAFARLRAAWLAGRRAVFDESMRLLAAQVAETAADREVVGDPDLIGRLRDLGATLRLGPVHDDAARRKAMEQLATRMAALVQSSREALIRLHGLDGHAGREALQQLAAQFSGASRIDEGGAAVLGGLFSGAAAGLYADLATGGLTLGGGMILGGLLGAVGAAGLARGFNWVRGAGPASISWTPAVLDQAVEQALLSYLAVAHFGRGRGDWAETRAPAHWLDVIRAVVGPQRAALDAVWRDRAGQPAAALREKLVPLMTGFGVQVLARLYPQAAREAGLLDEPAPRR